MTYKILDGVQQYVTGTGSGGLVLGGAVSAMFRTMQAAGMVNGDTTRIRIQDPNNLDDWEIVLVEYNSGTIERTKDDAFISSTGDLIEFQTGSKVISSVFVSSMFTQVIADAVEAAEAATEDAVLAVEAAVTEAEAVLETVQDLAASMGGKYAFLTLAEMTAFTTAADNERAYCLETKSYYRWNDGGSEWEFVNLAEEARLDTLEEAFYLTAGSVDDYAFDVMIPFLDESNNVFGAFLTDGSILTSNIRLGLGSPNEGNAAEVMASLSTPGGTSLVDFMGDGRLAFVRSTESEITGEDYVGGPIQVYVDEADNALIAINDDGTIYLKLSQLALDYVAENLQLEPSAEVPAGLFTEAAEVLPTLEYAKSTAEEDFPATYVYRMDQTTRVSAPAVTRHKVELWGSDGQSNNGPGGNTSTVIQTTPEYPHRNFTLNGSDTGGPVFQSLTPLVEANLTDLIPCKEGASQRKDTCSTSTLAIMTYLDRQENLEPPVRITWASGAGGRNIAELAKGTDLYDNDMLVARKAIELAKNYGLYGTVSYALALDQGEEDRSDGTAVSSWLTTFEQYAEDKINDYRALTRQDEPMWLNIRALCGAPGTGGITSPFIALAQYDAMRTLPQVTISHCDYFCKSTYGMGDDGVHFTNYGNILRGEYRGKAGRRIKQMIVEAGPGGWNALTYQDMKTCLAVVGATRIGTQVFLDLMLPYDSTTVVEDTTTLPLANNTGIVKGIKLDTGSGVVSAVSVINPNAGVYQLEVTLSVAGAGTLRGGVDPVDTTTTDRSNSWTNFKAPSQYESQYIGGLMLDNWLVPFKISYT